MLCLLWHRGRKGSLSSNSKFNFFKQVVFRLYGPYELLEKDAMQRGFNWKASF